MYSVRNIPRICSHSEFEYHNSVAYCPLATAYMATVSQISWFISLLWILDICFRSSQSIP